MNNDPKDFIVYHHAKPKKETSFSSTSIEVLPNLLGLKWNEVTMCYVLSLKPSAIRVSYGMVTCDAYTDRVTVMLNKKNIIKSITMEVRLPTPEYMCGFDMERYLKAMRDGNLDEFKTIHQMQKENGNQPIELSPGFWIGSAETIELRDIKEI